jgi:AcrR family transcriptional regulator
VPTRLSRAQQQELTRQRLLDASFGVFRQRGFAAATVDEIAELAGYTRGAFYSHFGSKEAAFVELLEAHAPAQIEAFRHSVETARSESAILRALASAAVPAAKSARAQLLDTVELAARLVDSPMLRVRALHIQEQVEAAMGWCAAEICRRRNLRLTVSEPDVGMAVLALLTGLAQRLMVAPDMRVERHATRAVLGLVLSCAAEA